MFSSLTKSYAGLANRIKRGIPKSLFGRFLLIIMIPNILMQLVAVFIFFERHWDGVSRHMAASLVGEIALVVDMVNSADDASIDSTLALASQHMLLKAKLLPSHKLLKAHAPVSYGLSHVQENLLSRLPYTFTVEQNQEEDILINIALNNGVLVLEAPRKRLVNPSTTIFVAWIIATSSILLLIAILFTRTQIRSIRRLSEIAEKFGRGQEIDDFKPSGAKEVRRAGKAFLMMKSRIKRQVEQRMEMLSGVSHDLKTPLTRIKLQLAMMDKTDDIEALQHDACEMEKMLIEYLDFAKGTEKGPTGEINMGDLIRSVVAGYRQHHDRIDVSLERGLSTKGNNMALRRALANLIDNGLRYGSHVWITGIVDDAEIIITVEDNGPGIAKSKRKEVFKPFYRLDSARNLDTAGSGLGLSITKDSVVSHGGMIHLEESDKNGVKAIIRLPK
jgi:two-component system osmolarity sensor histidine kinase EnvZ